MSESIHLFSNKSAFLEKKKTYKNVLHLPQNIIIRLKLFLTKHGKQIKYLKKEIYSEL